MNGKGKNLLIGWGFRGRKYRVSATEFFEDVHTHNTSEQIREDIWTNWFFGAFLDQETTRYTVSAQSVGLAKVYALQVDAGSYSCAAVDAALLKTSILSVSPAEYSVTINDAALIKIFAIAIDTATVAVTFNDFSVSRGYIMPFRVSYTVTGSELRGGIQLTKPATVVNEESTTADVVTEKTISSTITTQVVL